MFVLGIICLLIAAALVVAIIVTGTSQTIVFTSSIGDFSTEPVWVFVAGAVAALLAVLGLSFFGRGTRRRVADRREMRRLRRLERDQATSERRAPSEVVGDEQRRVDDEPDRHLVREQRPERPAASSTTSTSTPPVEDEASPEARRSNQPPPT